MKQIANSLMGAVMAMTLTAALGACSADDIATEQPVNTVTGTRNIIHVSVGAKMNNADTRATIDNNGEGQRTLRFTEGDQLVVYKKFSGETFYDETNDTYNYKAYVAYGTLDISDISESGQEANFSGDISIVARDEDGNEEPAPEGVTTDISYMEAMLKAAGNDELGVGASGFEYHGEEEGHEGISEGVGIYVGDLETIMAQHAVVRGTIYDGSVELHADCAILNCTINGLEPSTTYSVEFVCAPLDGAIANVNGLCDLTSDASGSMHFVSVIGYNGWTGRTYNNFGIKFWPNRNFEDLKYTVALGDKDLNNTVYNLTRTAKPTGGYYDLTRTEEIVVPENAEVTITQSGGFSTIAGSITIGDGATVTLQDIDVRRRDNAPIVCQGNATIILPEDTWNAVRAVSDDGQYAAIQPGPEGTTLTIRGAGRLDVSASWGCVAIGAKENQSCGNIVIEGGDIQCHEGMGIGSHYGTCGDITISGGRVCGNSENVPMDILGTYNGTCGDITISGGQVFCGTIIGACEGGAQCGAITICGGETEAGGYNPNVSGIGFGYDASCGPITITKDITRLQVRCENNSPIAETGEVTIDGVENPTAESTFPHLHFEVSDDGTVWTLWRE